MWSSNFIGSFKPDPATLRRICLALALSVLAHVFVLGGLDFRMPSTIGSQAIVKVQLAPPAEAPGKASQPPQEAVTAESVPVEPEPSPEPSARTEAPIADSSELSSLAPPETSVLPEADLASMTENVEELPLEEPEPVPTKREENAVNTPPGLIADRQAYIDTDFELREGGRVVGMSHISFRQNLDGTYSLVSTTEAKGLLSLFLRGKLIQTSRGLLAEDGLRPLEFEYRMTSKEEKSRFAQFDWQAGRLTLQTNKGARTVKLPHGAQDLLSFMYQFLYVPPLERMEIPITNGKKLDIYAYAFEGEEELTTPTGNLRTLHIRHHGKDDEKTDIWLAVDYKYMPVKIRKTEEDGSVIEQTVTRLTTDFLN
jgi:hypothetical protein